MARAYRLVGRASEAEGALAAALWEAGCSGVLIDGDDLVAVFADDEAEVPQGGSWEDVDETDHVAAYFEGLDAVLAGSVVVAPTHRSVTLSAGQRVIWLDPGMAFGTGHHESTRLALAALADPARDLRGKHVLDVGTGSGLLAIVADLLGAAQSVGLDVDPVSVEVARANAELNRSRASFELADFTLAPLPVTATAGSADLLVANLFAELHETLMPTYAEVLRPGGRAILSGILHGREALVRRAVRSPLKPVRAEREGEWWMLEVERELDREREPDRERGPGREREGQG